MSQILGIDPSLTATGFVILEDDRLRHVSTSRTSPRDGTTADRAALHVRRLRIILADWQPDLAGIEAQFTTFTGTLQEMAARSRSARNVSDVVAVLRQTLRDAGIPEPPPPINRKTGFPRNDAGIPPASGKAALTGSGSAKAEQMIAAAERRFSKRGLNEHEAHAAGVALEADNRQKLAVLRTGTFPAAMAVIRDGAVAETPAPTAAQTYAEAHGDRHKGVVRRVLG
jgi:Holliday junction resolvasome RuvABC endonuclease subunit